MEKIIMTLCCVYNDTHILLGEKKYGKLQGLINGFGGKVEEGETVEEAAARELEEECCIKALDLEKRGVILFKFDPDGNPFDGKDVELHIFSVNKFEGEPAETNEMRPQWFAHSEIPLEKMWPDDQYWMPLMLAGKNFQGTFYFKDPKTIVSYELKEVLEVA